VVTRGSSLYLEEKKKASFKMEKRKEDTSRGGRGREYFDPWEICSSQGGWVTNPVRHYIGGKGKGERV